MFPPLASLLHGGASWFAMNTKHALWLFVLLSGAPALAQPVSRPGTHELRLPDSGRRYTLVIPRGYDGSKPVPLVVALHYGGPQTPYISREFVAQLIAPALRDLGAIIVAPDNASNGWANRTAEQHVLELVSYIESTYNVDPKRTLLTGYSMGGMGTWYLAPRHPDIFEVAVPMAGRPQADSTSLDWRTPTHVLNSTDDERIPIADARAAVTALEARGAPIAITVLGGITHFDVPRYRFPLRGLIPWIERTWQPD